MAQKPKQNYSAKTAPLKDNCQTPPYAVDLIAPYLRAYQAIWEPCSGEGLLTRRLREHGFAVCDTDLSSGEDFFAMSETFGAYEAIVTNPPFSLKYKFLARCCELGVPFALLMPADTLFAGERGQPLIVNYGVEVVLPDRRINFKMPNGGWRGTAQFASAWFTRGLNIGALLTFVEMQQWTGRRVEMWERQGFDRLP